MHNPQPTETELALLTTWLDNNIDPVTLLAPCGESTVACVAQLWDDYIIARAAMAPEPFSVADYISELENY